LLLRLFRSKVVEEERGWRLAAVRRRRLSFGSGRSTGHENFRQRLDHRRLRDHVNGPTRGAWLERQAGDACGAPLTSSCTERRRAQALHQVWDEGGAEGGQTVAGAHDGDLVPR